MTVRSVRTADTTTKERRKASGQRVHFEAMVAVGGAEGGAAFEAESVDVSSEGMRLRTAYLPGIGDRLVCRFDGPGTELVAIGEVTWAAEQPKGGEFGLKFVELDPETEAALKELVAIDDVPVEGPNDAPKTAKVAKNARVKLHIEGLASPMKARVRDGSDKEVCVGSSLEFLKLGRQVEVEDVDAGERREGFVDGVKVEVDPSTSIPQLVVSLRFDAAMLGGARASSSGVAKPDADIEPAPVTRLAGAAPPSKRGDDAPKTSKKKESTKVIAEAPTELAPAQAAPADDAAVGEQAEDDEHLPPNKLRAAQERAKEMTSKAAAKIGPAFTKMGEGAKGMFASLKGTFERRREARDEAKKANAPRRVTAPPPSGALTSEGRRVVRQDTGKEEPEAPPSAPKQRSRKGIVMGAAAGLALVLGVVGVTKALGNKSDAPAMSASSSADAKKTNAQQVPPVPGAPATGDVPLFGPTPLSTTESVPAPPPAAGKKADAKPEAGDAEPSEEKSELTREWGNGEVKNAKAFTVKMDGPVEGFNAAEIENGFSISIPKHQSLSSSSALVRKDKRLTAVDIENREDGAEVRMKFKGEPPGYKIKVRGDKIEIRLGEAGSGAKAEDKKSDPKKVASKPNAKKGSKTDKKTAPKKPAAKKP